jgi:multiple antibiotic resistance protein
MIGTTMLLYGLINPVGVVPIYLGLVRRISPDRAHRIIVVSAATVAGLLAAAAGFGREILEFFNVGMDDFRIAGGCSSGCWATRASTLQHV